MYWKTLAASASASSPAAMTEWACMASARPRASAMRKSWKPSQPTASQKRMTVGSLTPAARARSASVPAIAPSGSASTIAATFRSDFRSAGSRSAMTAIRSGSGGRMPASLIVPRAPR